MRILMDTHAFLWAASGAPELSRSARACYRDPANRIFLSLTSIWEMAIKKGLGKLTMGMTLDELVDEAVNHQGIVLLPIRLGHVLAVQSLPLHHRDPFDRLLVAQAMMEGHQILSRDDVLDRYGIQRIW